MQIEIEGGPTLSFPEGTTREEALAGARNYLKRGELDLMDKAAARVGATSALFTDELYSDAVGRLEEAQRKSLQQAPVPLRQRIEDVAMAAGQAIPITDEIGAALGAAYDAATTPASFGERYNTRKDIINQRLDDFSARNPLYDSVIENAALFAPVAQAAGRIGTAAGKVLSPQTLGGTAAVGAAMGAGVGRDPGERLGYATAGATFGPALAKGFQLTSKAANAFLRKAKLRPDAATAEIFDRRERAALEDIRKRNQTGTATMAEPLTPEQLAVIAQNPDVSAATAGGAPIERILNTAVKEDYSPDVVRAAAVNALRDAPERTEQVISDAVAQMPPSAYREQLAADKTTALAGLGREMTEEQIDPLLLPPQLQQEAPGIIGDIRQRVMRLYQTAPKRDAQGRVIPFEEYMQTPAYAADVRDMWRAEVEKIGVPKLQEQQREGIRQATETLEAASPAFEKMMRTARPFRAKEDYAKRGAAALDANVSLDQISKVVNEEIPSYASKFNVPVKELKEAYKTGLREAIEKKAANEGNVGKLYGKLFRNAANNKKLKEILSPSEYSKLQNNLRAEEKIDNFWGKYANRAGLESTEQFSELRTGTSNVMSNVMRMLSSWVVRNLRAGHVNKINKMTELLTTTDPQKKLAVLDNITNGALSKSKELPKDLADALSAFRVLQQKDEKALRDILSLSNKAGIITSKELMREGQQKRSVPRIEINEYAGVE